MGGGRSGESRGSNVRLMDYIMNDLHLNLGLQQFNLAHLKMHAKPDRKLVQCRPLNAGNSTFRMEFGLDDSHEDVKGRIANKLQVFPENIKLSPHNCSCNLAGCVDPEYQFKSLRDVLVKPARNAICDVLHYYVEDPSPRKPKTAEVAYGGYPNAKQSFKRIAREMRSDEASYWLPTTVQLCGLLSEREGPWVEKVLEKKLVHRLLYFLTVKDPELEVEAAKALKYLASGTCDVVDTRTSDQAMNSTYGALWQLLHSENYMVLRQACCSLAVLSGCSVEFDRHLLYAELLSRIYHLTRHPTLDFVALRVLGNLMLRDNTVITYLHYVKGNVLDDLKEFLSHDDVDVRKDACWVISYLVAGNWFSKAEASCFDGLIGPLVAAMKKDEFVVAEAAVWAISNATFVATSAQIELMVKEGCIDILCELLCCRDVEIFEACLDGLENILKVGRKGKKAGGVNPYVEHMESIEGWTVLEEACCFYQKKMLYQRSLELMVKYGYLSRSDYKRRMRPGCGRFGFVFK